MGQYGRGLKYLLTVAVLASFAIVSPDRAEATVIEFSAIDLADIDPGHDLWMYEYRVSEFAFDVDQGFSVYFDLALYSNLQNPPPAISADWDAITLPPDLGLPSDGVYDVLALVAGASLAQPFSLTFEWLGRPGSAPGSQAFTVNQYDAFGDISFLESGETRPAGSVVPEPSSLLLLGSGFLLAAYMRRRA